VCEANLYLATVLCAISFESTEEHKEHMEFDSIHNVDLTFVCEICPRGRSGAVEIVAYLLAQGLTHKVACEGESVSLDRHIKLGNIAFDIPLVVVSLAELTRKRVVNCLLRVLSVVLVGAVDGDGLNCSHCFYLSFLSVYIISQSRAFVNSFFEKSCTKFKNIFVYVAQNTLIL
jgi:hypothetical protein